MKALFLLALCSPWAMAESSTATDSNTWQRVDKALSEGTHDAAVKVDKSIHEKPKTREHSVGDDLDHVGDELNHGWDKALGAVGIEKKTATDTSPKK